MESRTQESLRHSDREMVFSLTTSPGGLDCIGMTFGGKNWILYDTKTSPLADNIRRQLKTESGVDSIAGPPIDWRTSLKSKELKLHDDHIRNLETPLVVGIFVPADKFDDLMKFK